MKNTLSPDELLIQAESAANGNKYKTAIKHYKSYLALVPNEPRVLAKIAALYELANDEPSAFDHWEMLADSGDATGFAGKARLLNKWLEHHKASSSAERGLRIDDTLESAHRERIIALRETRSLELQDAAQAFLKAHQNHPFALSHLGYGLMLKKEFSAAEEVLQQAISIDPQNAFAHMFLGMLKIEQLEYTSAFSEMEVAYDLFSKDKAKSQLAFISNFYCHYKETAKAAAQTSRFGKLSVEQQFAILQECGVQTLSDFELSVFLKSHARERFDNEEPFLKLFVALDSDEKLVNGAMFRSECIYSNGDYVKFLRLFERIACGQFPLTDCSDDIVMYDDVLRTGGTATLQFVLHSKRYKWKAKYDNDWLDFDILTRLGKLAAKECPQIRFAMLSHSCFGDSALVLCLPTEKAREICDRTLIEFKIFE